MFLERLRQRAERRRDASRATLGPLERRVLDTLWSRPDGATVRDLLPEFPLTAYTTMMTTLERLHRKGLLDRVKTGRAFRYRPRCTREDLASALTKQSVEDLLQAGPGGLAFVLSTFVDAVGERDREALDELERLIRERRRARRREEPGP